MSYDDYDPDDPDAPQPEDLDDNGWSDEDDDDAEHDAEHDATEDVYSFRDETIACPNCGRRLHEDAALCPHCGEWIITDSSATLRSRGWFWPLMVGMLIALILVIWSGLRM